MCKSVHLLTALQGKAVCGFLPDTLYGFLVEKWSIGALG